MILESLHPNYKIVMFFGLVVFNRLYQEWGLRLNLKPFNFLPLSVAKKHER